MRPIHPLFEKWLHEVVADQIFVDESEGGLNLEARQNMWGFGVPLDETTRFKRRDVFDFLAAVEEARECQILERFGRSNPMILYCWVDRMMGELRFSLVSVSHGRLPFGAPIEETADLAAIADSFITGNYRDGIPIGEFRVATQQDLDAPHEPQLPTLKVWTRKLPKAIALRVESR